MIRVLEVLGRKRNVVLRVRTWRIVPVTVVLALLLVSFGTVAWFDDVESGENGWTHYWIGGLSIPDNWAIASVRWHSASNSWYSGGEVANWVNGGDTALQSPAMDLTNATTSYLNFWHWYDFDYWTGIYPDGGIVEIDNGSGWQQIFPVGGYPYVIDMGYDNPLEGRQAFAGPQSFWEYETFDISAYAGNIIAIRFHVGWDFGTLNLTEGWYIDDIEITNATLPQHDISVSTPNVPGRVDPNTNVTVGGTVRNNGMADETNVTVNLTVDGALVDTTTIGFLQNGTAAPVTFYWTPIIEKTYNVCLEATPVPGESLLTNNKNCVDVDVISIRGSVLIDQTHLTDNATSYSILFGDLLADGYVLDYQYTTPITAADLSGHDVFMIPQPFMSYSASELSAIQTFVSSGNGLLVLGDNSPSVFTSLTSFAGISWFSGGTSGTTTSITPHQITAGITAIDLSSPMCEMTVSGSAMSLIRDPGGGHALTISTSPGRVAGFSDESSFMDFGITAADNEQLALNIIEWLLGVVYDHDVAVTDFNAPGFVNPGVGFYVNATIKNLGLNNETNMTVEFKVDSVLEDNISIPLLAPGASQGVSFNYSTTVEGYYEVEILVQPVPSENFTGNNWAKQIVFVGYATFVGIYDHGFTGDISYFFGGNQNLFSAFQTVLDTDPLNRFQTTIITDLSSSTLSSLDVLLLPDNAVPDIYLTDVENFFNDRKGIVAVDSAICYIAYSGFLWAGAAGTNGHMVYWDYNSWFSDQRILMSHEITADYIVGNVYSSQSGDASLYMSMLPGDAMALTGSQINPTLAYTVAREEFGSGRIVELGPFADLPVPVDLHEMVRDAVQWASGAIPVDHDIAVSHFQLPRHIQPNDNVTIDVDIRNAGLNNETNIEINFTIDGVLVDQRQISFMSPDQIDPLVFYWVPTVEKTYDVCVQVTPVPDENITVNNQFCKNVNVKKVKAYLLFDQTHSCRSMASYASLRGILTSLGYVVDTLFTAPLTAAELSGYDVFILPEPSFSYSFSERTVMQSFVSSGHGLLLMGDSGTTTYSDITSFAGIDWTFGGASGTTSDITLHDVTEGVSSVYFPSPVRELIPTSPAISLVRDVMGGHVLAVSESPGRVAAMSDEQPFDSSSINSSDNQILAINLIEWLVGRRYEHDIEIRDLSAPSPMERWVPHTVQAKTRNVGLNDEYNITVRLLFDGVEVDSTVISQLQVDSIQWVSFGLTPSAIGTFDLAVEVVPIPDENETDNNILETQVSVQDTTPPDTPLNLQVTNAQDPTALELTWTPNTEQDLAFYTVYASVDGTNYYFEAQVTAPSCNFTDMGLLPGSKYYYQISASDDIPNESPRSSPAVGIPGMDHDDDGIIDILDPDDDNDGIPDEQDDFPWDPTEWRDTDGDGIGDNADGDDDGDGVPDIEDEFPLNPGEWKDSDGDGIGDNLDPDDDNDGVADYRDDFPWDPAEWRDTDGDGVGDNADDDDDGDGIPDASDPNPLVPNVGAELDLGNLGALVSLAIALLVILIVVSVIAILYFRRRTESPRSREQPEEEPKEEPEEG
ncbi:MAG: thrombospondin type 3 repeat-containing protein [Thermoplasmata archaeon]|nr:thrombospondin type 3 repeat-containing protein [Thermoplasmata archaeon]